MTQSLHAQIRQKIANEISSNALSDDVVVLNNSLRLLAKWRSVLIQNTILKHQGTHVSQGPFQGMDFLPNSAEGCHVAKLLGCYEQPLHQAIEKAIAADYSLILNIGCAEGYYAVGMARRMPAARIMAFDLNQEAQKICAELSVKNGVSERITVGALFKPEDFANHASQKTLVLCDIEGAEGELLNPETYPALSSMDLIVESHECLVPGITQTLQQRFAKTHKITLVEDNGQRCLENPPSWFNKLPHLDQLLAVWEWRSGPTPWLVMKAKTPYQPRS